MKTAEEHRKDAARLKALYLRERDRHSFDNLLPALSRIHIRIADEIDGVATPLPAVRGGEDIESWAGRICNNLVGIKVRPRQITNWERWIASNSSARNQ
jgi:hypothetical protein